MKRPGMMLPFFFLLALHLLYGQSVLWVYTDNPPANYTDEKGNSAGFLYEIAVEAFEKRLGIPLEISIYPWPRCQELVKSGKADMMVTIPTAERLDYSGTTETPLWVKRRDLYTYRNNPRIAEIDRLNGIADIRDGHFSVVSYIGNNWIESNVETAGILVEYANTVEGMYKMLAARRGDIMIEEQNLANTNIIKLGLMSQIVLTGGIGEESPFHIIIGKKSSWFSILGRLETVLEEMTADGTISSILQRYGM